MRLAPHTGAGDFFLLGASFISSLLAHVLPAQICMDARILPSAILGLAEGDVHVIRNAGGRAAEAVRSSA